MKEVLKSLADIAIRTKGADRRLAAEQVIDTAIYAMDLAKEVIETFIKEDHYAFVNMRDEDIEKICEWEEIRRSYMDALLRIRRA